MVHFIIFMAGVILSSVISVIFSKFSSKNCKPIGDLRVDRSDPSDSPLLFLELDTDTSVNTIINNKVVTFRVKIENFLPHD